MKKYTLTGKYTIIYVKQQTIEASSHEEAEEKFNKILLDHFVPNAGNARNCRPNYMGWEITENYESLEDGTDRW